MGWAAPEAKGEERERGFKVKVRWAEGDTCQKRKEGGDGRTDDPRSFSRIA